MKSNGRYVVDTNVLVSALLFEGSKPGKAFDTALSRGVILLSLPVLQEVSAVLSREKFRPYLRRDEKERFLITLLRDAELIEITEHLSICRDPKDNKWLELIVGGKAICLITGDEDLLHLHPFRGIPILSPDKFLRSEEE